MSKPPKHPDHEKRIAELEDELAERDRRIKELKADVTKADALVSEMREHCVDAGAMIERWIEAFDMVLDDDGVWKWRTSFVEGDEWFQKYHALLRDWNRLVPEYNAVVNPRNVGHPPGANDSQRAEILKLRKQGRSLRGIALDMKLGMQVVRTVLGQYSHGADRGKDRTSRKHAERIKFDRAAETTWKALPGPQGAPAPDQ